MNYSLLFIDCSSLFFTTLINAPTFLLNPDVHDTSNLHACLYFTSRVQYFADNIVPAGAKSTHVHSVFLFKAIKVC